MAMAARPSDSPVGGSVVPTRTPTGASAPAAVVNAAVVPTQATAEVASPAPVAKPAVKPTKPPAAVSAPAVIAARPTSTTEPTKAPAPASPVVAPVSASPRPAKPAADTGRLVFRATGGVAEVRLDGVLCGRTPLDLDAAAGSHRIELRDVQSGLVAEQSFVLIAGVERRIEVRLED